MQISLRRFRAAGLPAARALARHAILPILIWTAVSIAAAGSGAAQSAYDQTVLADQPVAFWDVGAADTTEPDLTGNGNTGTYPNGLPAVVAMPNGDAAADFNPPNPDGSYSGSTQYLSVPSNPDGSLSIPATGNLTWEAWIAPDVLQFLLADGTSWEYVHYMGKCDKRVSLTCEWAARMYGIDTIRPNRLSAYAFNPIGGLGSGADWQPVAGLFQAGQWLHVVGEYTTQSQPDVCVNADTYPGSIDIWVNGVKWNQSFHGQTGCMSQFMVIPQANNSPFNIGTLAYDRWFEGAIAKVAIYNYLLTQDQITNHYTTMTGQDPTGSCTRECSF